MNLVKLIDFLRDRLSLVIKAGIALLAVLVLADIARVVLFAHEVHEAAPAAEEHASHGGFLQSLYHIAETLPVFWSVFGFIACVLIVYVSKAYGHLKVGNTEIMTREDYYNE